MTPTQRKHDLDLANSMRTMAQNILPRSRRLHDIFKLAAARIEALSHAAPIDPEPQLDPHGQPIQPASTSDQAQPPKQLEPMRD